MGSKEKKYTVVIVDDQPLVRSGYKSILSVYDDIEVVGEATNGVEAIEKVQETNPNIALMDIRMTKMNGIEATKRIVNDPKCKGTRVLVMTTFDLDEYVYEALKAGAGGFLLKDAEPEDIANAIRTVSEGTALIQPSVMRRLVNKFVKQDPHEVKPKPVKKGQELDDPLTERESEILELVAQGLSNQEIGEKLFISPATAKTHLSRIMQKTNCHSRAQLVVYYNQ
jgi:DNA-binding NarL/FixJ family response regulator